MISNEWLAGFFDGEGCFYITGKGSHFDPAAVLTNTDLEVLKLVQAQYGGTLHARKVKQGHTQSYGLYWRGRNKVQELLDKIYQFLILKKKEAEILYRFLNETVSYKSNPLFRTGKRVPEEEINLRLRLKDELSSLKSRSKLLLEK